MNTDSAFCHVCQRVTPSVHLPLSSGLVGNCCAICRACRKGKPYLSKRDIQRHDAYSGQGVRHARQEAI